MSTTRKKKPEVVVPEKSGVFRVSHSKIKLWRKCRHAYHLKYVEKLKAKKKSRPLMFGTMVHTMMEHYINGDDPFEYLDELAQKQGKLFASEIEEYGDIVEDVRVIMTEYFDYWEAKAKAKASDKLTFVRKNKRGAEHKFEIELMPDVLLVGKIDAVGKAKNMRWLVEHKSFNQMPNEDHRWRNLQSALYIRVNDILGWEPVDGTLWDYIHSKPPAYPSILKSGKMSQKAINTLPTRVIKTLEEHDLDPKNFGTMMKAAEDNRARYFQRIFNPKKRKVIDMLYAEMMETVQEMVELSGKQKSRTIERHCDWCEYEPICRAMLQGDDPDWIKERFFYVDQEDHSKDWEDAATEAA